MRMLYIDIDSLRADHLGCYGYHRPTSPNIDAIAREGTLFRNVYVTDAPCLPSRTALWSGRFGYHTGVVNHGGVAAQPFIEGPTRQMQDEFGLTGWMAALRAAGFKTVTVSSFGERHSAWHWYAGFNEVYNSGRRGQERAEEIAPVALDWLERHGREDNWFLHVNFWDPHTPYRTPTSFGNPFAETPLPSHFTSDYWRRAWEGFGPHSPQEANGFAAVDAFVRDHYPHVPHSIPTPEAMRWWIDNYDVGILYADAYIGHLFDWLHGHNLLDETLVMVGADHGEALGELNVWADHQAADHATCRVPLIVRAPGVVAARTDDALHYHFDWAATLVEWVGGQVPLNWDARPFTASFRAGESAGRDYLVTSQGAWAVQRGVRFDDNGHSYMALRTYHDGYKMFDDLMLFDLTDDPFEQTNLAADRPVLVQKAMALLEDWTQQMMRASHTNVDPLMTSLREGGAQHTRGELPAYLERLRATGRGQHADALEDKHPTEAR